MRFNSQVLVLLSMIIASCVQEQEMIFNNPSDPGGIAYEDTSFGTSSEGISSSMTSSSSEAVSLISTFIDPRDNETYNTIIINTQTWMSENLRYLPQVDAPEDGSEDVGRELEAFYYVYGHSPLEGTSQDQVKSAKTTANYKTYGVLYNWTAALSSCPVGWHLASDAEWESLASFIVSKTGLNSKAMFHWLDIGKLLKASSDLWVENTGTDIYGFSGLPAGDRASEIFSYLSIDGYWWSSTEGLGSGSYYRNLTQSSDYLGRYSNGDKSFGFSVRCVKD